MQRLEVSGALRLR